jgi:hypothetical protein
MPDRDSPRITLNALAEYLTAPAGRRRTIVSEQKSPKTFRVAYYAEAEDAIIGAIAGHADLEHLDRGRAKVRALPTGKAWDVSRRDTQLEAIESARAFLQGQDAALLQDLMLTKRRATPLLVGPVSVSVRPEMFVEAPAGTTVGALKLYFSKTSPLSDERARYAGVILQMAVERLRGEQSIDYRKCLILDVFAKRLHQAPRTYQRRRQDVDAACAEIAAIWST